MQRTSTFLVSSLCALFMSACVAIDVDETAASADVTHFKGVAIAGTNLPFSKAVKSGGTIYLAGELGIDPTTNTLAPGGAGPETTQIFRNYERTLAEFGADLSDVVKCTVFLRDMADYAAMNAAYAAALPDPKPARSTVAVKDLAFGAALEIECIAAAR